MSVLHELSGCACCSMSRRSFIAGCATCVGAMVIPMTGSIAVAAGPKKKRIRVLYSLHADVQPRPDWPNVGFDFNPVMERMTAALSAGCPGYRVHSHDGNGAGASAGDFGKGQDGQH